MPDENFFKFLVRILIRFQLASKISGEFLAEVSPNYNETSVINLEGL